VESILKQGIDKLPLPQNSGAQAQEDLFLDAHENLRGKEYFD
jgi:hypothetical protein